MKVGVYTGRGQSGPRPMEPKGGQVTKAKAKSRKTWSERVKALLSDPAKGRSMESLAAEMGVSFFTVLRWKNGEVKPSKMGQRLIEKMEEVK